MALPSKARRSRSAHPIYDNVEDWDIVGFKGKQQAEESKFDNWNKGKQRAEESLP
jgi:hypothetical protein